MPCNRRHHTGEVSKASGLSTAASSKFGSGVRLEQKPHVQEGLLQVVRHLGRVGVAAAVEGRDGKVDVLGHGVVADAVAVGDGRTVAHDAVGLGGDLKRKEGASLALKNS